MSAGITGPSARLRKGAAGARGEERLYGKTGAIMKGSTVRLAAGQWPQRGLEGETRSRWGDSL